MVQTRAGAWRHKLVVGVLLSTMVLAGVWQSPASADVTAVEGSAYGCYGNTTFSFEGTPPGPPVVTGPLPEVELPAGGSADPVTATEQTCDIRVAAAPTAPAVITTGPLTVSTQGTTGPTGSVTSTAEIENVNRDGQEALDAASISSTCTADESGATGSTTVTGGTLLVDPDATEGVAIPTNPEPGYTVFSDLGVATSNYIFNEQIENADGSITVNAVRIEPLTGPLQGTVILGQVVCGVTADGNGGGSTTTSEPDGSTTTTAGNGGGTTTTTAGNGGGTTTTTAGNGGGTTTTTAGNGGGTTTTTQPAPGPGNCERPTDFVGALIFDIFRGISDLLANLGITGFEDFGCDDDEDEDSGFDFDFDRDFDFGGDSDDEDDEDEDTDTDTGAGASVS